MRPADSQQDLCFEGADDAAALARTELPCTDFSQVCPKQMEWLSEHRWFGLLPDTVSFGCSYLLFWEQVVLDICVVKAIALIYQ